MKDVEYAGFWVRVGAALIDSVLFMLVILPIITLIYGKEYWLADAYELRGWGLMLNYVFPAIAVVLFWVYKSATPGKMLLGLKVVDASTGQHVPTGRLVLRYLGYYLASIPLLLGIIWVGFDKKKQGWHDKLAGTLVVKNTR
ncbi:MULTISPECIES: RDD family protein [Alkalimonas]|uniref:RDD family protein n=1 Tax=Alkalimonas mucilaginosa TaxID=3057676 RepID=A0ABU7JHI0_9GAMM|nr:RDD family protein [Alkalimonas sp. MEB004]MEE2025151.1 RDD family protein [Alkalimonas sp. MEB004]